MAEPPVAEAASNRHDLSDLLDQLHDDIDIEASSAGTTIDAPLTDPRDLERPTGDNIVIESTGGLEFRPDFASFGTRFAGALIDGIALSIAMLPGWLVIVRSSGIVLGALVLVAGFFLANVWYASSVSRTGQWIGNRIMKTKVVNGINGSNLDMGYAGARFAARHIFSVILLLGFLIALTDPQRRTFHDRVAGSVVVGRQRATWSADDEHA